MTFERELPQKILRFRLTRGMFIAWLIVYGVIIGVLGTSSGLSVVWASALMGFWLVAGSGSLVVRVLIVAVLFYAMASVTYRLYVPQNTIYGVLEDPVLQFDNIVCQFLMVLLVAVLVTLLSGWIYPGSIGLPRRLDRFTLHDLAGWVLFCALLSAFVHHYVTFDKALLDTFTWHQNNGITLMAPVAMAVCLGNSWQLVPKANRDGQLRAMTIVMTVVLSPLACSLVLGQLFRDWNGVAIIYIVVMHAILAAMGWLAIYPMECVGLFSPAKRSADLARQAATTSQE